MSTLIFSTAFDVLTAIFAQTDTLPSLSRQCLRVLAVMLARLKAVECNEGGDSLIVKFSALQDDASLQGIAQLIVEQIETSNEYHSFHVASANEGMLSKLSSMFSSRDEEDELSPYDSTMDLPCLFVLFESIRLNKAFVSTIITTRSSLKSTAAEKELSLLLRYFLTYCSLSFEETRNEPGLFCGRLCLLTLVLLTDNVFVQNALHDPQSVSVVPLFRPAMLHRPAQLDCARSACTMATTALDLVTELLVSHLKIGFPLEFYDLSLGIVHRILAYQKNRCIRMVQWQQLFNAMLSLLRFLIANESKCNVSIYPLCYRVIVVLNLFLTYGDTFLPSGEAYDLLYYELVRQESVFTSLLTAVMKRLDKEKDPDWEYAAKVKSHLINPMIIVNTVKERIAALGGNLQQEEIIDIIKASFETLSLKLYDGLTMVSPYEHERQKPFFNVLSRALHAEVERKRTANVNPFEYSSLVENLSSIAA